MNEACACGRGNPRARHDARGEIVFCLLQLTAGALAPGRVRVGRGPREWARSVSTNMLWELRDIVDHKQVEHDGESQPTRNDAATSDFSQTVEIRELALHGMVRSLQIGSAMQEFGQASRKAGAMELTIRLPPDHDASTDGNDVAGVKVVERAAELATPSLNRRVDLRIAYVEVGRRIRDNYENVRHYCDLAGTRIPRIPRVAIPCQTAPAWNGTIGRCFGVDGNSVLTDRHGACVMRI